MWKAGGDDVKMKWKKLNLVQRGSFRLLAAAQILVLLLFAFLLLTRDNRTYNFPETEFVDDGQGNITGGRMRLPAGIYRVQLNYFTDTNNQNFCTVEAVPGEKGKVLSSGEHLNVGMANTDFDLWIGPGGAEVVAAVSCTGGDVRIDGIHYVQTSRDITRNLFLTVVLFAALDSIYLLGIWKKVFGWERKKLLILFGLGVTILLSCIPVWNDHIYAGSDVTYHLLRIGNIKDGFLSGQFPVRMDPSWLWGNGYVSSIMYGEIFLYFPAFLRLIGFTLQESWMWFLAGLNVAACLVSYYSFRRIFRSEEAGLLCSALYTLSIYQLFKAYSWSAIGEVQALVFLPLILYAAFEIFTGDMDTKEYKRKWIPLAIGFSGLIQCHVLSCELAAVFLGLTCIILWRRTFRRPTLLVLVKAVAGALVWNAWFLVPFLDYMLNVDMVIHHVSARTIQETGLLPAQLLFGFFHRGESRDIINNGLRDVEALGVGLAPVFGLGVYLFLWFGRLKGRKEDRRIRAGGMAAILAILAMAMSLAVFPWTGIQFLNGVTEKLVSSIQYTNRFLMIATVLLVMTAGASFIWLCKGAASGTAYGYGAAMAVICVITGIFYMNSVILYGGKLTLYDEKGLGTGYLSGAEYLPYGTDQSRLEQFWPRAGEGVSVSSYDRQALGMELELGNTSDEDSYVEVSLLNYKGYVAEDMEGAGTLTITGGENNCVRVIIPAGYEGKTHITFKQPWYWVAAGMVSLAGQVLVTALYVRNKYARKRQPEQDLQGCE